MMDTHRYDLPVLAYMGDKTERFANRQDAARSIARRRGCHEHTADKMIRKAIYARPKEVRYGYYWSYIR